MIRLRAENAKLQLQLEKQMQNSAMFEQYNRQKDNEVCLRFRDFFSFLLRQALSFVISENYFFKFLGNFSSLLSRMNFSSSPRYRFFLTLVQINRLNNAISQGGEHIKKLKLALTQVHTNQLALKKREKELVAMLDEKEREMKERQGYPFFFSSALSQYFL